MRRFGRDSNEDGFEEDQIWNRAPGRGQIKLGGFDDRIADMGNFMGAESHTHGRPGAVSASFPNTPFKSKRPVNEPSGLFGGPSVSSFETEDGTMEGCTGEAPIGIDLDLMEELACRQRWTAEYPSQEEDSQLVIGEYSGIIENEGHVIMLRRSGGIPETSASSIGKDVEGKPWSLQTFSKAVSLGPESVPVLEDWRRITHGCPFASNLEDAFVEAGSLTLVYCLDGGALSMASALESSITSGGFITGRRNTEEILMEQWIGQLLWTLRQVHQDANWFIGPEFLWSPQNIHLVSQNYRLLLFGLGAVQLLSLARSPLPFTGEEIRSQQNSDFRALSDLIKGFLSGPRRWLVRSATIAPIISFLEQRAHHSHAPIQELFNLPATKLLLNKLFVKSFRRQEYLENQLMIQVQSERILALLAKLSFINERFKNYESLKTWPSRQPLVLFHHLLFGPKNIPGVLDFDILHVMGMMRQVDLGSEERILLSKDGSGPSIVVSFAEIAFHIEESYESFLCNKP